MKKDKTDNILEFGDKSAPRIQANFNQILHQTHRLFVQEMTPGMRHFFDSLDDFFFDLAEKAESNSKQNLYFEAMMDTRNNKILLLKKFAENINIIFQKFKNHDFVYFIDLTDQNQDLKNSLTLIKEDDLDQKLAINNVIAKVSTVHHDQLFALNSRFAELVGQTELENSSNPVGADAIVNAFALSLSALKSENTVKLMIFKLFERNLVETLEPAYIKINGYLKEQGICPEIKFEIKRNKNNRSRINDSINYLAHALSDADENYKKIADILNQNQEEQQPHYSVEKIIEFSQLSDALNQIKVELLSDQELETEQSFSPLELKDELLKKLKSLKALSKNSQVSQADENTIDLIGQLFQYLVEDRNLPETIQLILSKLQLPYLQIALRDNTFFSDKKNNARRLLDTLAQASIGWTAEVDNKQIFLRKVKEIVSFILKNHEKQINYEKLIERFRQFEKWYKKKSIINERRVSEKMSGKEKLDQAKAKTAAFIRVTFKQQKIPVLIRSILLKPWANVLILSHLREAEGPEVLIKNKAFVKDLIHAGSPNSNSQISSQEIERLCSELERGLKYVAYDKQKLTAKVNALKSCLSEINVEDKSELSVEFIEPEEVLSLSKEFQKKSNVGEFLNASVNPNEVSPKVKIIKDQYHQKASEITKGDWVEIKANNSWLRAKLSWVSPISGKLLFVNAKGAKVIDLFPIELADKLRKKEFHILQQIPVLDRAMSSIAKKMKKKQDAINK